jgi:hypothetical protein
MKSTEELFYVFKVSTENWNPIIHCVLYDKYKTLEKLIQENENGACFQFWTHP